MTPAPPSDPLAAALMRLDRFEIETPSWAYADSGTRFGRFAQPGAAVTIEEKLADAAEVHRWTGCCPSVAVHVDWDFPEDSRSPRRLREIAALAGRLGVRVGSINPTLFEQPCYKWGSLTHRDAAIRRQAVAHVVESIALAREFDSKIISLWLADGTNYPGQGDIRRRRRWLIESLGEIHAALPADMLLLLEYKPFEPAFYHTDVPDWGAACLLARAAGPRCRVLVDMGHHLPGANIEQIVAWLAEEQTLGGFHFNDRKYADDDLLLGSIDPYQLFRVFFEITAFERESGGDLPIAYMVDQSANVEPKIEAQIRTVTTAQELFVRARLVDFEAIESARAADDVLLAERAVRSAFETDVRPLLVEWRRARGLPADPLLAFRESGYAQSAAVERAARR